MDNERGLTLAEVLAAVVLLGLVVTLFVSLSGFFTGSGRIDDHRTAAAQLAENELNIRKNAIKAASAMPSSSTTTVTANGVDYRIRVLDLVPLASLTAADAGYGAGLDGISDARRVSMQSVVYAGGVPKLLTVVVYWSEGE